MLRFGGSSAVPEQRGMPHPPIKYALAVPRGRKAGRPTLHAVGCADLPDHDTLEANALREIVWSTTYDGIEDYAARQFGEDGWQPCPSCHAINGGDTR